MNATVKAGKHVNLKQCSMILPDITNSDNLEFYHSLSLTTCDTANMATQAIKKLQKQYTTYINALQGTQPIFLTL